MSKNINVSIIINNFNYGGYLSKAIESAINQRFKPEEIIVVDDGSTDSSEEVIVSYKDQIVPIFQDNKGQASAFNTGFAASRGNIIVFLDADDYLYPHALEEIVKVWNPFLSKVQYRLEVVDSSEKVMGLHPIQSIDISHKHILTSLLNKSTYVTSVTSGNAYSRLVLEKILPVPELDFKIAADGYLNTLVPLYGKVAAISKPLGAYRMHTNNLWASSTDKLELGKVRNMLLHDFQRHKYLAKNGVTLGYWLSSENLMRDYKHILFRLISLRLDSSSHPVQSDNKIKLLKAGVKASLVYSPEISFFERVKLLMKFFIFSFLPLKMLKKKLLKR